MDIDVIPYRPSRVMIEGYAGKGPQAVPKHIRPDHKGYPFPYVVSSPKTKWGSWEPRLVSF